MASASRSMTTIIRVVYRKGEMEDKGKIRDLSRKRKIHVMNNSFFLPFIFLFVVFASFLKLDNNKKQNLLDKMLLSNRHSEI